MARRGVAQAESAPGVATPGPQRAVAARGQACVEAGGDRRPVAGRPDARRGGVRAAVGVGQTKLTERVLTPGPQRAAATQRESEAATAADGRPVARPADAHRSVAIARVAQTELAEAVGAPGPKTAVALQREGRTVTTRDRDPGRRCAHARRCVMRVGIGRAQAKLPVVVVAPAPQRAVAAQGDTVVVGPAGHRRPVRGRTDTRGRGTCVLVAGAELPEAVGAPGPQRTVAAQGETAGGAGGDRRPVGGRADARGTGMRVGVGGTQAELTEAVGAPGPQRAVAPDRQAVMNAAGDLSSATAVAGRGSPRSPQ